MRAFEYDDIPSSKENFAPTRIHRNSIGEDRACFALGLCRRQLKVDACSAFTNMHADILRRSRRLDAALLRCNRPRRQRIDALALTIGCGDREGERLTIRKAADLHIGRFPELLG